MFVEYCLKFGHEQIIYNDDFPVSFKTELEENEYIAALYRRCLREEKPLRAYVTPVSATIEYKEGVIYK